MRLIITGKTEFLGTNITAYLNNLGYEIIEISRTSNSNKELSYITLPKETWDTSYTMIYLAGKAHDLKKTSEDLEYYKVNTELTKCVFDQFLKSYCDVFIYISSVKAEPDIVNGVLTEEDLPNSETVYVKSKLAAEQYILSKELPKDKRVYFLGPCMTHESNNKGNLNALYSFILKGISDPFAKYDNKRSFVSVNDLFFITNQLLENNTIPSGIYNIADDTSLSTNQLVQIIGSTMQQKVKLCKVPKFWLKIRAFIGDAYLLRINSKKLQKLTENYEVSIIKIKNLIQKELTLTAVKGIEKTTTSL